MVASGRVDVFHVRIDAVPHELLARYVGWLSPDERDKHGKMASEPLRNEYLVGRALTRWALSRFEPDVAPHEWRFERTESGRPFLVGPRSGPAFNLSHAGGLVVCAVGHVPVGVDVEPLSRGDELVLTAPKMFSPAENAALLALPEDRRPRRAVELWTTKEAYVKARGEGISVRLTRFGVAVDEVGRHHLDDVGIFGDDPTAWQLEVREVRDACEVRGQAEPCVIATAIRRGDAPDVAVELVSVVPT